MIQKEFNQTFHRNIKTIFATLLSDKVLLGRGEGLSQLNKKI